MRLIPGLFVKLFVKTNKSGCNDAEAIAEAVPCQNMHFEPKARRWVAQPDDRVATPLLFCALANQEVVKSVSINAPLHRGCGARSKVK